MARPRSNSSLYGPGHRADPSPLNRAGKCPALGIFFRQIFRRSNRLKHLLLCCHKAASGYSRRRDTITSSIWMRLRFAGHIDGIDTTAVERLNLVSEPWQPSPKVKPQPFSPGRLPVPVHDDYSAPQSDLVVSNRQITVHLLCLGFGQTASSSARVSTLPSTVSARL